MPRWSRHEYCSLLFALSIGCRAAPWTMHPCHSHARRRLRDTVFHTEGHSLWRRARAARWWAMSSPATSRAAGAAAAASRSQASATTVSCWSPRVVWRSGAQPRRHRGLPHAARAVERHVCPGLEALVEVVRSDVDTIAQDLLAKGDGKRDHCGPRWGGRAEHCAAVHHERAGASFHGGLPSVTAGVGTGRHQRRLRRRHTCRSLRHGERCSLPAVTP